MGDSQGADDSKSEREDAATLAGSQITTLQVRSDTGKQTLILKMRFGDTIGDVRREIGKLAVAPDAGYQLRTAFPARVYDDDTETLQDAGLTPNATLLMRTTAGK